MSDLEYSRYVIIGETPKPILESGINTLTFDELKQPSKKKSYSDLAEFVLRIMKKDKQEGKDFTPVKPEGERISKSSKERRSKRRLTVNPDDSD
tara:strand:- start:463 stop:744 length:282 start_codon:yes stop_codon:yes gene_type:complete